MNALVFLLSLFQADEFDEVFTGNTFRFDYYHSGIATEEHISLDEIRLEGLWPGSRTQLIDKTNLGKYLFEVVDLHSNQVIYSRGFCSIYGEWETTAEAGKGIWKSFHESLRFPEPRNKCQLVLKKRLSDNSFSQFFTTTIDPKSRFINRSALAPEGTVWTVFENGPSSKKVDILILSEGYTLKEKDRFHKDVERLVKALFNTEPYRSRKNDFNVRAIDLASAESGLSNPRKNIWKQSALGLSFNSFDSDRYVLTNENKKLREVAAQAPYDALYIVFNDRKYGGGGIFNLWSTVSAGTEPSEYIFVHEFGHSFAGLADEYYTSPTSYEDFIPHGVEPWDPNITAFLDPGNLKWKHLIASGTPLPTHWNKDVYDRFEIQRQKKRVALISAGAEENELETLFKEVKDSSTVILKSNEYYGKVGVFEGAGYESKGLYRAELDCIMFTRNDVPFCKVCQEAISKVINLYSK
jgi:hypothetical protein